MDTTQDLRKKKKESEPTSEKPSRARPALRTDEYVVNDEVVKMAPDLAGLPEFDWESPDAQGWINAEDQRLRTKFAGMNSEDLDAYLGIRKQILEQNPGLSLVEAGTKALEAFRSR